VIDAVLVPADALGFDGVAQGTLIWRELGVARLDFDEDDFVDALVVLATPRIGNPLVLPAAKTLLDARVRVLPARQGDERRA
jgi:hypothetical protein